MSSRSRPDLPKASLPEPSRIPIRTRKPLRGPVLQYHSSTTLLLVHTLLSTSTPAATAAGDKGRCVPRAPLHPDASLCAHDPKTSFHTMIILMFPTRCYCCAAHAQQTWSMSYRFEGGTHSTKVLSASAPSNSKSNECSNTKPAGSIFSTVRLRPDLLSGEANTSPQGSFHSRELGMSPDRGLARNTMPSFDR